MNVLKWFVTNLSEQVGNMFIQEHACKMITSIIMVISTQAGFSADGAGGSGLPAEGTWALSRALTQRTSQKIVFSFHQGSGGWGPSLLATDLVLDPFLIDHFLLLTSK